MLNSFVQPASVSAGLAVEGVQPVQGFAPYNQLAHLLPAFQLSEDGGKPEDEEKKNQLIKSKEAIKGRDGHVPDLFRVAFNVSFREMIEFFLIPDQDKVINIRGRLRNERGIDNLTIISPIGKIPPGFEDMRDQLYEFQMQIFSTPKGLHCHIIL